MDRFRNQSGLLDEELLANTSFVVIGAGAIGSFFVTTLAKMGAKKITVYDMDTIEEHNISNQMYPTKYIGLPKAEALSGVASDYGDVFIDAKGQWDVSEAIDGDIIVVAVDNMDTRKAIWDHYKNRPHKLFLEGRMSAQVFRVYGIASGDWAGARKYESSLYPQSEASEEPCGQKSIIYTVLQVSGQMLSQVKRYLMKEYRPTEVIHDCLNDNVSKYFTMEKPVMETIEAPEEVTV